MNTTIMKDKLINIPIGIIQSMTEDQVLHEIGKINGIEIRFDLETSIELQDRLKVLSKNIDRDFSEKKDILADLLAKSERMGLHLNAIKKKKETLSVPIEKYGKEFNDRLAGFFVTEIITIDKLIKDMIK